MTGPRSPMERWQVKNKRHNNGSLCIVFFLTKALTKGEKVIMSRFESTTWKNSRASFFSSTLRRRLFAQPPYTTYLAWQKQLKRLFLKRRDFLKNTSKNRRLSRRKRNRYLRKKLWQFTAEQVMEVLEQLSTTKSEKKNN